MGSVHQQLDHFKIHQNNNNDSPAELSSELQYDWSDLPQDMLRLASTKLASLDDIIHFRIVCKNWCSVISLPTPPPRPTWIFLNDDYKPVSFELFLKGHYINKTLFFSLERFDFCTHLQEVENMQLVGTTYNYTVLLDENRNAMYLVNPITGKINPLPPFPVKLPPASYLEVDPIQSSNIIIIRSELLDDLLLLICRPGDKKWKIVQVQVPFLDNGCAHFDGYSACGYFKGLYYIGHGKTSVVKLKTRATVASLSHPLEFPADQRFSYLIESFGELIGVWKNKSCCSCVEDGFKVFSLENEEGGRAKNKWVEINNIGDRILFLNRTTGFCFRANDFPGYKENSIYFFSTKGRAPFDVVPREVIVDLCRYNITNGKIKKLKSIGSTLAYWFFPTLQ